MARDQLRGTAAAVTTSHHASDTRYNHASDMGSLQVDVTESQHAPIVNPRSIRRKLEHLQLSNEGGCDIHANTRTHVFTQVRTQFCVYECNQNTDLRGNQLYSCFCILRLHSENLQNCHSGEIAIMQCVGMYANITKYYI